MRMCTALVPVQNKKSVSEFPLVFVYGSLKRGFYNEHTMKRANGRFIGEFRTKMSSYKMVSLGSFPGVVLGGNDSIAGEVWEVDSLDPLDALEGYPDFYTRISIGTDYGPAWMYILSRRYESTADNYPVVSNGEWKKTDHE